MRILKHWTLVALVASLLATLAMLAGCKPG